MNWIALESENQISEIIDRSTSTAVVIFKHSTSCAISSIAKNRLVNSWDIPEDDIIPYYLDILKFRNISNQIADRFDVVHESPQVLLIKNQECIYENSHLDINIPELKEAITHKVI